ncbi:MAG: hypothetical protein K0U21_02990 [Proteobacteria bacterium]|nr:hypothetical protein [Pseudomonadota bacterium]
MSENQSIAEPEYRIVFVDGDDKTVSAYSQTLEQQRKVTGTHLADFVVWEWGDKHCLLFNPKGDLYAMTVIATDGSYSLGTIGSLTDDNNYLEFDDIPDHVTDVVFEKLHKKIANPGFVL